MVIEMNKLEQLINEFCPEGVEYKALGELGEFYSGLNGKSNDDFNNGNAKFITYMNVFSNPSLKIDIDDKVKIEKNENQNTIQYGDVIFTGSSETPEECGMSSVLTSTIDEKLYLNSFCFGFRFYDEKLMLPEFSKYVFRSSEIRKQIKRTASGVTRFNISKKKMEKVTIPLPPILVQEEIVRILDKFTELAAELATELAARKQQYEYYKSSLLTFGNEIEWKSLGDVCIVQAGGTPSKNERLYWENGNIKWLSSTVCKNQKNVDEITNYITEQGLLKSSARMMKANTTLVALVGATIGKVAFLPFKAAINQNIAGIYPINDNDLDPSYIYYACTMLYPKFLEFSSGKLAMANLSFVRNLKIPVPPLEEQQCIVDTLDHFEKLCNDISEGLPAEIEARQKQYEYYRDKLLTFKKKEAVENEQL